MTQAAIRIDEAVEATDAPLREFVGYAIKRAYIVLNAGNQAALAELGLRVLSFSCLSVIVGNPGIAPSALADRLKMERSNLVLVIDELETRELVTRAQSKSDRRRFALTATAQGRRLHKAAVAALRACEARSLRRLTEEEKALLVSMMGRIEAAAED